MGRREATIEDLARVEEKAEIVGGELVLMPAAGGFHGYATGEIFASLREYARRTGRGVAFGDSVGFIVDLPNRRSFSPDAAFWTGPLTRKFADGAPVFAVEIRSEEDYGPAAERAMAARRADYFAAGTLVVWDVDHACAIASSASIAQPIPHRRRCMRGVSEPKPSPPCPAGRCRSTICVRRGTNPRSNVPHYESASRPLRDQQADVPVRRNSPWRVRNRRRARGRRHGRGVSRARSRS